MTVVDERIPEGFGSEAETETSRFLSALAALQAELPKLPKDKTNPHFHSKFTGLDTIVDAVGPLLVKHRLVWMTMPGRDQFGPYLEYRLVHVDSDAEGGIFGRMPLLLTKDDMQGLGSALTYARRYALSSVLNLVADEDDDGSAASGGSYGNAPPANTQNLQQHGRGLSNPALTAAFQKAGIPVPSGSLWMALTRVPDAQAAALYAALQAAKLAESQRA
jgi:hypothetical protein